jgi:predicted N-acetyltransferase YhbS
MSVELVLIDPTDARYPEELELRFRVLREPLGHGRSSVAFPFERDSLHLLAVQEGRVVGCVLFHPEGPCVGRLFQMAVAAEQQRTGLGSRLVRRREDEVRRRGFEEVTMHARQSAVPFYERLGYEIEGAPFEEVGVPHRHMRRRV